MTDPIASSKPTWKSRSISMGKKVLLGFLLLCVGTLAWEIIESINFGKPWMCNLWSSSSQARAGATAWHSTGSMFLKNSGDSLNLRAWAPSFSIVADAAVSGPLTIEVTNVLSGAKLDSQQGLTESISGTTRRIEIAPSAGVTRLAWKAPEGGSFTFAVTGDTHGNTDYLPAMANNAKFIIIVGDVVASLGNASKMLKFFDGLGVPVYTVPGNHDLDGLREKEYVRNFSPYNYYFTYGETRFVFYNNVPLNLLGSENENFEWLSEQIDNASSPLTFLFMHKPPFHEMSDTNYKKPHIVDPESAATALINMAAQGGIDGVFCGHIHEYHRWQRKGVPYIISGEGHVFGATQIRYALVKVDGSEFTIMDETISTVAANR